MARAHSSFRSVLFLVIVILTVPAIAASATFCPPLVCVISVETPTDLGWFFKAVAPDREAMKVERQEVRGVVSLKVFWGMTQAERERNKRPCGVIQQPTSFLLTAQKDGKTLEYRFRIPEDMELVPGSKSVPRSKKAIVMLPANENQS